MTHAAEINHLAVDRANEPALDRSSCAIPAGSVLGSRLRSTPLSSCVIEYGHSNNRTGGTPWAT